MTQVISTRVNIIIIYVGKFITTTIIVESSPVIIVAVAPNNTLIIALLPCVIS